MCYMRMQTVAIEHWVRESAALDNYSMAHSFMWPTDMETCDQDVWNFQ